MAKVAEKLEMVISIESLLGEAKRDARSSAVRLKIESRISEEAKDYARRLAEKALCRRLLNCDDLDGARFKFLFRDLTDQELNDLRDTLDSRMLNGKTFQHP